MVLDPPPPVPAASTSGSGSTTTPTPVPVAQKRIGWPMFKWSPDEKYIARTSPGVQISVYEVPSMNLLGKKSVKIDGVVDFEWCPMNDKEKEELNLNGEVVVKKGLVRENVIAFWTPEVANQPARVTLMNLPSRIMVRSKNLFNVHDVRLTFLFFFTSFPSNY